MLILQCWCLLTSGLKSMFVEMGLDNLSTHKQPLKTFYLCYVICTLAIFKIPLWSVYYLPRFTRPVPSWSWKTTILTRILRWSDKFLLNAGLVSSMTRDHLPPLSAQELKRIGYNCHPVWMAPVLDEDIQGEIKEWKERNRVQSVRVPGYWWGENVPGLTVGHASTPEGKIILSWG